MNREIKIKVRIVIYILIFIFVSGTIAFHFLEGWSWIDSFYFLCVTITTIGYGDLYPTMTITKIITIIYAFMGIGIILVVLQTMTKYYIQRRYIKKENNNKK